jgi:dipeptidyl aminopeptidase/acylaminoacyl peptidase
VKSFFAVFVLAAALAAPALSRPLVPSDFRGTIGLSEPRISPDGRSIAFVKSTPDYDKDDIDSQIFLIDVASGKLRQLTYGRTGINSPRWSPAGDRLAFIADDGTGDDAESQIYVMPMDGGDAVQVTNTDNGVDVFAWKPDGSALAYVTEDTAPDKDAIDKNLDAFEVGDLDYKQPGEATPFHLWLTSADGKSTRRLTSGAWSLDTANSSAGATLSWSADGRTIAVTKYPNAVYGDSDDAVIALVDAKSGKERDLPGQRQFSMSPLFAPVGDAIASVWFRHGIFNSNDTLVVGGAAGGVGAAAMPSFDHNIDWFGWMPSGKTLAFAAEAGPKTGLWLMPLGGTPHPLAMGDVNVAGDANVGADGSLAFIGDTPGHPSEVYYAGPGVSALRRLTDLNHSVAALPFGAMREVAWTGPGGYAEDGILTEPPGFSSAKKYPLVLVVHGGPQGASQLSFNELSQVLASHGYLVFEPNYRGSTNLGDAYQHAIFRDTGVGPGEDAMAGVAAVEQMGIVDTSRLAVSGWSYGGYMTTWLESHYDVWKCAMSGAALTDWVADYTIAWYQKGDADFFGRGSSPWNDAGWKIWRDQSPISYARNVKAPTLIMGDVGDANVPIYNSYQWYHALKDNGVPVTFVAYPRDSHYPDDPVGGESVEKRWVDWIVEHLH